MYSFLYDPYADIILSLCVYRDELSRTSSISFQGRLS